MNSSCLSPSALPLGPARPVEHKQRGSGNAVCHFRLRPEATQAYCWLAMKHSETTSPPYPAALLVLLYWEIVEEKYSSQSVKNPVAVIDPQRAKMLSAIAFLHFSPHVVGM